MTGAEPPAADRWAGHDGDEDADPGEWSAVWDGPVEVTGVQPHLAYLPWPLTACGALLPVGAVVGALVAGVAGAVAAVAGILTVVVFFTVSALAVAWADRRDPALTLPVALATYLVKVVVAGVLAFGVVDGAARWHGVYAAALGAGLAGWLGAHLVWFRRTPPPTVSPAHGTPAGPRARSLNGG